MAATGELAFLGMRYMAKKSFQSTAYTLHAPAVTDGQRSAIKIAITSKLRLYVLSVIAVLSVFKYNPHLQPLVFYTLFAALVIIEGLRLFKKKKKNERIPITNCFALLCLVLIAVCIIWPNKQPLYPFHVSVFLFFYATVGYLLFVLGSCIKITKNRIKNKTEQDGI